MPFFIHLLLVMLVSLRAALVVLRVPRCCGFSDETLPSVLCCVCWCVFAPPARLENPCDWLPGLLPPPPGCCGLARETLELWVDAEPSVSSCIFQLT